MKLLLDENLIGSKEYFNLLGHDVTSVDEYDLRAASDDKITKFAKEQGLMIITKDRKMEDKCRIFDVPYFLISDSWIAEKVSEELQKRADG